MTKVSNENKSNNANVLLQEVLAWLESNKQSHNYCDDTWYSCPKHQEGCTNDGLGKECNCGADEHNVEIQKLCDKIRKHLA